MKTLFALCLCLFTTNVLGPEPKELVTLRTRYQHTKYPSEAARQQYLLRLVALRERLAKAGQTAGWQAVDTELKRHPAPNSATEFAQRIVGQWHSPRRALLFRADGTWTLLPAEPGTLHGRWKVTGNQYLDTVEGERKETTTYTILLLTKTHFVFTDGTTVFYETRRPS